MTFHAAGPPAAREDAAAAAARVLERTDLRPRVGVVLGSGLGGVADALEDAVSLAYTELPGFRPPSVGGHAGRLVVGLHGRTPVVALAGRAHVYEGSNGSEIAAPVRTLRAMGCETVVLTCAAGSLDAANPPGSLVAFADHINLQGTNPLIGPNDEALGPRFPPLAGLYDADLRARLRAAADAVAVPLAEGVYLAVTGPTFETPAEIRAFRTLGADLVGMSTVPEALAAAHCGLRVAAVANVTNLAEGMSDEPLSHAQTLAGAERGAANFTRVLGRFLEDLA